MAEEGTGDGVELPPFERDGSWWFFAGRVFGPYSTQERAIARQQESGAYLNAPGCFHS